MCDMTEEIDDIIVYEYDKDCDSVEEEEYQGLYEKNNVESASATYMLTSSVEALEDAEVLQEQLVEPIKDFDEDEGSMEISENERPHIKVENVYEGSENYEKLAMKIRAPLNGPQRYLLFDDLIANVVDHDEEGTPIVQFSMPNKEDSDVLPIECGICPDVMAKSKLAQHLKTHLMPDTNRYQCIYCSETYKDYKYLASHARRHMGIRPYVCEICKLYFSTKQDMRVHNQRRHQEKGHICEICGKTFSQNTMLKRHRESTHEKKRRFQCEHCPKAYYKNFSLQEHVRSVHMGQRRMLKCPFCGMQCLDAHKMARHRKLWHLNQKHFECEICQEKFTNVHYFDAHKRSIQCRNNTQRKIEEEQQQQQEILPTETKEVFEDDELQIEASDEEVPWHISEEQNNIPTEFYDSSDQFVELVVHEQVVDQSNEVVFEITLDANENN